MFSASSVNWLLTCYFFVLGIFALAHLLTPIVARISPECLKRPTYQLMFLKRDEDEQEWREMVRCYIWSIILQLLNILSCEVSLPHNHFVFRYRNMYKTEIVYFLRRFSTWLSTKKVGVLCIIPSSQNYEKRSI